MQRPLFKMYFYKLFIQINQNPPPTKMFLMIFEKGKVLKQIHTCN